MKNVDLHTVLRKSGDVVAQSMPPDTILLNLENGYYYSTNRLGAEIWNRCDGKNDIREIIQDLHHNFDVPLDSLTADVMAFVKQMVHEGLLIMDENGEAE